MVPHTLMIKGFTVSWKVRRSFSTSTTKSIFFSQIMPVDSLDEFLLAYRFDEIGSSLECVSASLAPFLPSFESVFTETGSKTGPSYVRHYRALIKMALAPLLSPPRGRPRSIFPT